MIASLSSLTKVSMALAMASSTVTCFFKLLFSSAEHVTESGVAAMALPSKATFLFVFPFFTWNKKMLIKLVLRLISTSVSSSVFVLITSAQELGGETSLDILNDCNNLMK